jgi:hypothetical protein
MSNKIKRETDPLKQVPSRAVTIVNSEKSILAESAEAKALQRISTMEQENNVDWVVIEPSESVDIETVRERIQKRGYKVST